MGILNIFLFFFTSQFSLINKKKQEYSKDTNSQVESEKEQSKEKI